MDLTLYTYGQPRVGDTAFSNHVFKVLPNNYIRVVHYDDGVVHMPLKLVDISMLGMRYGISMLYLLVMFGLSVRMRWGSLKADCVPNHFGSKLEWNRINTTLAKWFLANVTLSAPNKLHRSHS